MFWAIAGVMVAIVALAMIAAFVRGQHGNSGRVSDIAVYKDQLAAVDRDLARDVVTEEEADRLRTEIKRRILDADRAGTQEVTTTAPKTPSLIAAALSVVVLAGGSYGLYQRLGAPGYPDLPLAKRIELAQIARANRPDQAAAEAQQPERPPAEISEEFSALMTQLRNAVAERPNDLRGHELLVRNEAGLGNLTAAWQAQDRVIGIKGDNATAEDFVGLAELLIQAAGGYVSPEAEGALAQALGRDRSHPVGRFYTGLMHSQTGRPDLAFGFWEPLLRQSQATDPWVNPIRAQIEEAAFLAGIEYSLPPLSALRGPTDDDIAAAEDLSPAQRMEMIRGMVGGLSDRLSTDGGPPEDWARLIRSLGILGEQGRAAAIWQEAQKVFPDPVTRLPILQAARDAGVAQ
ncbi:c-type cytochrome biogenesis protein CcmI [Actibacterium sp. 188UL27-1]|uniref:c-type cytochrome biogenesis protein CcmI n=1 Tax=Actibacterium sp. 188UL27-1 TaxID=2786961 RepID=UPI00351C70C7